MGGTRRWPYGSTARVRSLVLLALGVVKVATASQLRQLVLPGTADAQTVRNACKDLKGAGLVESVGSTSRPGKSGQPVTEQLWNLTTAGLAAAATELDRPLREMGGTARDAAKAGAAHALKVTDTIDAIRQSEPLPTKPVGSAQSTDTTAAVPAQPVRQTVVRPQGLGKLRGWTTEVALPVVGTFTAPGRGSLRADAVLTAPEDSVPVLFVEVDNHTEPPAQVADKIARYRRFFQRATKDHRGRDVPLWSTLWADSGRGGFPPVAIVFTKPVGPSVMRERIGEVGRLSQEHWQGRWHTDYNGPDGKRDGYRDYADTVPVLATTLALLADKGPHGPVWWRYGHDAVETLDQALDNPDDQRAYQLRDEQRRAARQAEEEARHLRYEEERRVREASKWACPSCGVDVYPDSEAGLVPGVGECFPCRNQRARLEREAKDRAEAQAEGERARRRDGLFGWRR
ncbi:replication-relaxation family protein [Streptomyces sp. NPDC048324]|uniref:replication-relaxation family protein n=1 Tax=Streptomyces sp. NPDC048324 TaxID=3157205 RepID=UPI00344306BB